MSLPKLTLTPTGSSINPSCFYSQSLCLSPVPFLLQEFSVCHWWTRGRTSTTAGTRWCGSGTCTPWDPDCTCWSVPTDRSTARQSRACTVSRDFDTFSWSQWQGQHDWSQPVVLMSVWTVGLLEIRPVDPGCVAIRGVASSRFLCIEDDGTLYSAVRTIFFYCCWWSISQLIWLNYYWTMSEYNMSDSNDVWKKIFWKI